MLYPLDSRGRSHSSKLDFVELRSFMLEKEITSNRNGSFLKLPSLSKEGYHKQNISNEAFRSILQKSVSLDLT